MQSSRRRIATWTAVVAAAFSCSEGHAENSSHGLEIDGDVSMLFVLGPVSGQASPAVGTTVGGPLSGMWRWAGGARLGFPAAPEVFARVAVAPEFGHFLPSIGCELGASGRASAEGGDALLAELRTQSRENLSPFYVAWHAAPLRFAVFDRFRLSFLEVQLGTHLTPFGEFVRAQLGFVNAGAVL